ncbi:MAG: hypothetical protein ABSE84_16455, partial [Isosphaeraceae bacterium]
TKFFRLTTELVFKTVANQSSHVSDQLLSLRLAKVPQGKHRGAWHAADHHVHQVLVGRNPIRRRHQPEMPFSEISGLGVEEAGRRTVAFAIVAMARRAVPAEELRAVQRRRRTLGLSRRNAFRRSGNPGYRLPRVWKASAGMPIPGIGHNPNRG